MIARARKGLRTLGLRAALLVLWGGLVLLSLPGGAALAQDLPQWRSTTVNDFAGLIEEADRRHLEQALDDLARRTGVQGTVVTMPDRASYARGNETLEAFATRLFNHWGVGQAGRDDGFMLLVLPQEREARIELGRGYPGDADILAQEIMRNTMLPDLRQGRYSQAIRAGTDAVIALIAEPQAQGRPIAPRRDSTLERIMPFLFGGAWLLALGAMLRKAWRRNRCPQCGHRSLQTTADPLPTPLPEGGHMVSHDQVTRRCPDCGWQETRQRLRPQTIWYGPTGQVLRREPTPGYRASRDRSGGFGGGSSRGGGASGRW